MFSTLKPIPVAAIIRARCMRYSLPSVLLFLWADPVTWAKIKIKIEVKLKLKFAYIWLMYRWPEGDKCTCITFIIGNSLRMHSSRLPNMEHLPCNSVGANQSNENSTLCTIDIYFRCFFLYC